MTHFDQRNQHVQNQMNLVGPAQINVVGSVKVLNADVHWPVHVNVPAQPKLVIGREDVISQFVARLKAGENLALAGLPGVGKTTLAVTLANHPAILEHFSDGVLWGPLGQQAEGMRTLARWAEALGRDVSEIGDAKERAQAVKNIIAERRLLLIIDDAWSLEAANLLRCGGPYCSHLLTTRNQLIAEQFTSQVQVTKVEVLDDTLAYELLATLAPKACEVDPASAKTLVKAVGGLPLAIELLGSYLACGKSQRQARYFNSASKVALTEVANVQRRLQLAGQRLGAVDDQKVSLAETIRLSLSDLPELAVQAFYALGAFAPKPEWFDQQAAEFVTGVDSETLAWLLDYSLVEIEGEQLALHQVVADVARMNTEAEYKQRHYNYYFEFVNKDRENWQQIDRVYGQIKWAWPFVIRKLQLFDFIAILDTYQDRRGLWADRIIWLQRGLIFAQKLGWRQREGDCLNSLGNMYLNLGRWEEALALYEASLKIKRELGDRQDEVYCLMGIGHVYADLGQWEAALAQYEAGLKIMQEFGDRQGEAYSLISIGNAYRNLGRWKEALAQYEASLKLSQELGSRPGEAHSLVNMGNAYRNLGRWKEALARYKAGLKLMQELGDRHGESTCLRNLGSVYTDLNQWEAAIAQLKPSLKLSQELGDRQGESDCLMKLGNVYRNQGRREAALARLETSLKLMQELGDRQGEGACRINLGIVYADLEQWEAALTQYEASLKIKQELGDRRGESICLLNLGVVYTKLERWEDALAQYEASLKLSQELGDRSCESSCRANLGNVYRRQGRREAALAQYEASLKVKHELGDRQGESTCRLNLGHVYADLGRWEEALAQLEASLKLEQELGDRQGESDRLIKIGIVYRNQGRWETAISQYEASLKIKQELNDRQGESTCLMNLGIVYRDQGKQHEAVTVWKEALLKAHPDSSVYQQLQSMLAEIEKPKKKGWLALGNLFRRSK